MGLFNFLKKETPQDEGFKYYKMALDIEEHREEYLEKAIALNEPHAKARMAKFIIDEKEQNQENLRRAVKLFEEAVDQGVLLGSEAKGKFGYACSLVGEYEKSVQLHMQAAEEGNVTSKYNLGLAYANGQGVPKDYEQAADWYRQAMEEGNESAANNLAYLYSRGLGVEKDLSKAFSLYLKAAKQENPVAYGNVALCCYNGTGTEKNDKEALKWAKLGKKEGITGAEYVMAMLMKEGKVVPQNLLKAVEELRYLAKRKDYNSAKEALPEAEEMLKEKAEELFEKGLKEHSAYKLHEAEKCGISAEKIYDVAEQWYKQALAGHDVRLLIAAADLEHIDACFEVAYDACRNEPQWKAGDDYNDKLMRGLDYFETYKEQKNAGRTPSIDTSSEEYVGKHLVNKIHNMAAECIELEQYLNAWAYLRRIDGYNLASAKYNKAVLFYNEDRDMESAMVCCKEALKCPDLTEELKQKIYDVQQKISRRMI